MAPEITHTVIGERVFTHLNRFDPAPPVYGAFLLGCVLVDANAFNGIDRRQTHFVGRLDQDGEGAFQNSCSNFVSQLDALLRHPWDTMIQTGRAFVTGYLCHLAVDEHWKERGWQLWQERGFTSWAEFSLPSDVVLTASDAVSKRMLLDEPAIAAALAGVTIPNVLTHVPHAAFQKMWDIVRDYVLDDDLPASYFRMRERHGKSSAELEAIRREHDVYWEEAISFICQEWGIEAFIQGAIERSVNAALDLWNATSQRSCATN